MSSTRPDLGPSACSLSRTRFALDQRRPQRHRGALPRGHARHGSHARRLVRCARSLGLLFLSSNQTHTLTQAPSGLSDQTVRFEPRSAPPLRTSSLPERFLSQPTHQLSQSGSCDGTSSHPNIPVSQLTCERSAVQFRHHPPLPRSIRGRT